MEAMKAGDGTKGSKAVSKGQKTDEGNKDMSKTERSKTGNETQGHNVGAQGVGTTLGLIEADPKRARGERTASVRVVRKKDILRVLRYEKRHAIQFNQMPNDAFIRALPNAVMLPVVHHFAHNGIREVRAILALPPEMQTEQSAHVLMDIPRDYFDQLELVDLPANLLKWA